MNLANRNWNILYGKGVKNSRVGLNFDFPNEGGAISYAVTKVDRLRNKVALAVKITPSLDAEFKYFGPEGGLPANCRIMIMKDLDSPSGVGRAAKKKQFDRWWCDSYIPMVAGTYRIVVPLAPYRWSSVFGINGSRAKRQFNVAMREANWIGITFGGGSNYGHGIYMGAGSAKFKLLRLTS